MKLADLRGRSLGILGVGSDVQALLSHLSGVGAAWLVAYDDKLADPAHEPADPEVAAGLIETLELLDCPLRPFERLAGDGPEVLIRSPGFSRYRPGLESYCAEGRMTTPLDLWLGTHGPDHHITLVTGTKGKTTTTLAVTALLEGRDPVVAGNLGVPIWSVGAPAARRPVICEMSSYQASDVEFSAQLGVITNLAADHLDWHGSIERYHADKLGPLSRAGLVLASPATLACDSARRALARVPTIGVTLDSVTEHRSAQVEAFFAGLASHVAQNYALALCAAEQIAADRIPDHGLIENLEGLPNLAGRQSRLGAVAGLTFVDDALASNPLAAAAAIDCCSEEHVWLLIGGADRGVPLDPLIAALERRSAGTVTLIGLPDSGAQLCDSLGSVPAVASTFTAASIDAAVTAINPTSSGVVLFSPAAATPPLSGSWQDRSAGFVAAYHAYRERFNIGRSAVDRDS